MIIVARPLKNINFSLLYRILLCYRYEILQRAHIEQLSVDLEVQICALKQKLRDSRTHARYFHNSWNDVTPL